MLAFSGYEKPIKISQMPYERQGRLSISSHLLQGLCALTSLPKTPHDLHWYVLSWSIMDEPTWVRKMAMSWWFMAILYFALMHYEEGIRLLHHSTFLGEEGKKKSEYPSSLSVCLECMNITFHVPRIACGSLNLCKKSGGRGKGIIQENFMLV